MPSNQSGQLSVELLGPPRAWLGQDTLALGPARQQAVFAVLALRANRGVTRAELIDSVWGDSSPASAEGGIYTYVSGLRRILEPHRSRRSAGETLTSQASGYALRLADDALDVTLFDQLREQGNRLTSAGDHQGAVDTLDKALGLWRGEALSGIPGPFAETHRGRLAELRLAAIEQRARAVLQVGGHTELSAELAVLVNEYPLRESLHELLMIALYRSGRHAEALEVFRDARRVLVEELGIEPGASLHRTHERILVRDPELDLAPCSAPPSAAKPSRRRLSVVPAHVSRSRPDAPSTFVGREREAQRLRELLAEAREGHGRAVWIEGELGIGKSELLNVTLADAEQRGCQLAWSVADELNQRVPLRVITECLDIDAKSPDARRAQLAAELQSGDSGHRDDPSAVAVDRLLGLIDDLCASAPLVLVIDDLQWADDTSLLVWQRLCAATQRLPLLLVAAVRPTSQRQDLAHLRHGVESRNGEALVLSPLTGKETEELVSRLVSARPGPGLRDLTGRVSGNPLYVREMVDALIRDGSVAVRGGLAEVNESSQDRVPRSMLAAIGRRLDVVSAPTREVLRWGALLGLEFSVTDLASVTGKQASQLLEPLEEAVVTGVLIDADPLMAFRHSLLRQALYDGIPGGMRAALHRQAAEALADAGVPVKRVAEQLIAASGPTDLWTRDWLATHDTALINSAPLIAAELFERAVNSCPLTDPNREHLLAALVKVLFRIGRDPEQEARNAFAIATDPCRRAEMRQLLAAVLHRKGETAEAIGTLSSAERDPDVPAAWNARHTAMLSAFRRGDLSDLEAADENGEEEYTRALASDDAYSLAHALQTKWLVSTARRDHEQALLQVNRALEALGRDPELSEFRFDLLDNKIFTLQNLDLLDDAEGALRSARTVAAEYLPSSSLPVTEAMHEYWLGSWDEALAAPQGVTEDGPAITFYGRREPVSAVRLLHGVAALIAGRRDDGALAATHLNAAENYAPSSGAERENCDFLLVAKTVASERHGETDIALLDPILNPGFAPLMVRHQWLPYLVRLAWEAGDLDRAHQALAVCQDEAAKETRPARAFTAAARCQGLIAGDPEPVMAAVEHYRRVGRPLELAEALEDVSVLFARRNRPHEAQSACDEAIGLFSKLGARWDVRRTESRLRPFGIRRTSPVPITGSERGWGALSHLEAQIAVLAAEGRSNPRIASELGLPRRAIQAYVARVLEKLHADPRTAVTDEVRGHAPNLSSAG